MQAERAKSRQMFLGLLLLFILFIIGFSSITSSLFAIGRVEVEGNRYITTEEIYQIAGIPERMNIFRLNTGEIQSRLEQDLRIEGAIVTRQFPSTIQIVLEERIPLAYVACEYGFVEVDRQGIVLAAHKSLSEIKVPIVTGIVLNNLYVGDAIEQPLLLDVLKFLALMDETTVNQISEINVENPEKIIAYTNSSAKVRIGDTNRLDEKAKLTEEFLQELKTTSLPIEYMDLTFASPFIKFKQ